MASRAYRRDSHGRFAGSGGGTKVTYGKAGGFANAAFRGRVQAQRASGGKSLGGAAGAKSKGRRSGARTTFKGRALKAGKKAAVGGAIIGGSAAAGIAIGRINNRALVKGVGIKPTPKPSGPNVFDPMRNRGVRTEAIPMAGRSGSLRDAVKASAAAARPPSPNYSSAAGRKDYVGRRVTDGNYGLKLGSVNGKKLKP